MGVPEFLRFSSAGSLRDKQLAPIKAQGATELSKGKHNKYKRISPYSNVKALLYGGGMWEPATPTVLFRQIYFFIFLFFLKT